MATTTLISQYEVIYSANTFFPRIGLLNAGKYIGQLIFKPDGSALPQDNILSGQPQLYYHLEDFSNIINLLRSEKTMYLLWAGSGPGYENALKTNAEPLG